MNEIQASLNAILNNGSIGQALSYAGIAVVGFAVVSLLFRSLMMVMLGAVATFYVFFLNTPETALTKPPQHRLNWSHNWFRPVIVRQGKLNTSEISEW